jgi:hypothetical protein
LRRKNRSGRTSVVSFVAGNRTNSFGERLELIRTRAHSELWAAGLKSFLRLQVSEPVLGAYNTGEYFCKLKIMVVSSVDNMPTTAGLFEADPSVLIALFRRLE